MTNKSNFKNELLNNVIKGIQELKGKDITVLDLTKIDNAVCKYFVICSGDSTTQVQSIADSIEEEVKKTLKIRPWHKEGYENREWILIDYSDVVAHVFLPDTREFYELEHLWSDAVQYQISEIA
jgi:ribosome-associated protein